MSGTRHLLTALLAAAAATGALASASSAQTERNPALAEHLFQRGLELLDAGDDAGACPLFRDSMAADPSVGALLNVARCSEREGKLARAWAELAQARVLNDATADPTRRDAIAELVEAQSSALEPRLPRLAVRVTPAAALDLVIRIDGVGVSRAAFEAPSPIDPGEHVIEAEARGYAPARLVVRVAEAERAVHTLTLSALPARPAPPAPRPSAPPAARELAGPVLLGGGGLLAAGVGATLLGLAAGRASTVEELCGEGARPPACDGDADDARAASAASATGETYQAAGIAALVVGAGALAGGALWLGLGDADTLDDHAWIAPAWGGLAVGGRF